MNIVQLSLLKNAGCAGGCKFCGLSVDSQVERKAVADKTEFEKSYEHARQNNARLELVFPSVGAEQKQVFELLMNMQSVIKANSDIELAINPGICTKPEFYKELLALGVHRYRNNLECSRRLFKEMVPKRPLAQEAKLKSMTLAQEAGLRVDTGWLCGLGETEDDIEDILILLEQAQADSITLNFFDPRESAETFAYTEPSSMAATERYDLVRRHFPDTEITLGGATELWLGIDACNTLQADGVYIGRFLDHGLKEEMTSNAPKRVFIPIKPDFGHQTGTN